MFVNRGVGNKVVAFATHNNETEVRAECATPADAEKAASMLNRAGYMNDVKRKYTAAARLFAQVEDLPGFRWID